MVEILQLLEERVCLAQKPSEANVSLRCCRLRCVTLSFIFLLKENRFGKSYIL